MASLVTDRDLVRRARRIAIRSRRRVSEAMAGGFRSVFRGSGIEFESVREYAFGDDVRAIDWNVTARFGRPFVKQFVESRERSLWLVVDRSASLRFGTGGRTKEDLALELAAMLALAAQRDGDRVGLLAFARGVATVLAPARGPEWSMRLLHALLRAPAARDGTDLAGALGELRARERGRAIVFVVSDFQCPIPSEEIRTLARRHDVVAACIADPREQELDGTGIIECVDPESGTTFRLDAGDARERRAFAAAARERREALERTLARSGASRLDLRTDQDPLAALLRFFAGRERAR